MAGATEDSSNVVVEFAAPNSMEDYYDEVNSFDQNNNEQVENN